MRLKFRRSEAVSEKQNEPAAMADKWEGGKKKVLETYEAREEDGGQNCAERGMTAPRDGLCALRRRRT